MTQAPERLDTDRLRRRCRLTAKDLETARPLEPGASRAIAALGFGQKRALEAIDLAEALDRPGYNLFVMGAHGEIARRLVRARFEVSAKVSPPPSDWVYVNNFKNPDRPRAIELPSGRASPLRAGMAQLIDDLGASLPAVFESDDYRNRRETIDEEVQARQEAAFQKLAEMASERGAAIVRTPMGFAVAPMKDEKVIPPEDFRALPEEERARIEKVVAELQEKLQELLRSIPRFEKERREAVRRLDRETAKMVVEQSIQELTAKFCDVPTVCEYLEGVRETLIEHAALFLIAPEEAGAAMAAQPHSDGRFEMFSVNVMIGREDGENGAPVAEEDHPTFQNIVGRIEHVVRQGALVTNFSLIKPGALHRANGGVLLLDARQLLSESFAWPALKRALKARAIRIVSPADFMGVSATVSLDPDPIPLDCKIVIIGERLHYYLLQQYDPELGELFKVVADFEDDADWSDGSAGDLARLLAGQAEAEELKPLEAQAGEALVEHAARLADDATRLSLDIDRLMDRVREADHFAGRDGRKKISRADISRAISAQQERVGRIRERALEMILREIALVDTAGEVVGQINGLSVSQVGDLRFGRPARITAQARMGAGQVMDIEREVDLGGPLHSKGVLILSGYLAAHYALDVPISLSATLVFEQSYGGVDGDSASSTELYALLSALSGLPLRQDLAVTGSVNQHGQVQAIGGVNEKIEGFFDICSARGLTGSQGVMIPQSNVQHLMLREDVVAACDKGDFSIYPVASIDDGITLLTGKPAGERGKKGQFPPDSVNAHVEAALLRFAKLRRDYGKTNSARGGRAS